MTVAVPFGMESADFKQLMLSISIIFAAALVVVVLATVVRDIVVARYHARGVREPRPKRERSRRPRGHDRLPGMPQPRIVPRERLHESQIPSRPPAADPRVWPEPTMAQRDSAARLRTPSPASDRRETSAERISGSADRDADRTRLDITPTEET